MAEQEALGKIGRDGRRVQGGEGTRLADAVCMDRLGDELLAGTRLAGEQDVTVPVLGSPAGHLQGTLQASARPYDVRTAKARHPTPSVCIESHLPAHTYLLPAWPTALTNSQRVPK